MEAVKETFRPISCEEEAYESLMILENLASSEIQHIRTIYRNAAPIGVMRLPYLQESLLSCSGQTARLL